MLGWREPGGQATSSSQWWLSIHTSCAYHIPGDLGPLSGLLLNNCLRNGTFLSAETHTHT